MNTSEHEATILAQATRIRELETRCTKLERRFDHVMSLEVRSFFIQLVVDGWVICRPCCDHVCCSSYEYWDGGDWLPNSRLYGQLDDAFEAAERIPT